jgi:outer membrane protein assembly factor BamB
MLVRRMSISAACVAVVSTTVFSTTAISSTAALGQPRARAEVAGPGWAQSGGSSAHTALVANPGGLSPATVASLTLTRSVPLSDYPQTTPAVVNGTAYVATHSGLVIAVSTATGHQIWQHRRCTTGEPAQNSSEETTPAVGDGSIFVTESGGQVMSMVSLSAPHDLTCVPLEPATQPSMTAWSPTLSGRTVYEITPVGVVAIDATTGHIRWSHPLPAGADPAADVTVWHGVVYAAFNTYAATGDSGHVDALRPRDGHLLWQVVEPRYISTLAASGGRLVAGGGRTTAWDATTGHHLWTGRCEVTEAVTLIGQAVIVTGGEAGTCQGSVERLDAATGAVVWDTPIASELEDQASAGGGLVYLVNLDTDDVDILRLSDGTRLRSLHRSTIFYDGISTPVVLSGALWVISTSMRLDEWALPR